MSKISVTTVAGLTSGSNANKVIIESGDSLEIPAGNFLVSNGTSTFGTGGIKLDTIKSSGGTAAMTIDSSGIVLQPAKPSFFAYMGSGSFAPDVNNTTKTPLNSTLVNIGNCWSTTNHEFTAPVAGTYFISWGVTFQDPDEARYVASRVYKNGSLAYNFHRNYHPVEETEQGGNDYGGVDHTMVLPFTAGEKFYVVMEPSDTLSVVAEEGTYMNGFLIG